MDKPIANSSRKIGNPSMSNMIKYGMRKAPPPFFWAR